MKIMLKSREIFQQLPQISKEGIIISDNRKIFPKSALS
jgi:hypothetical protein